MNTLEQLNQYINNGWKIFPLAKNEKFPLTKNGYKDATSDENQITECLSRFPESNWGMATGEIIVIDIDTRHGGSLESFPFPETLTVKTGNGGFHLYYKNPGYDIRNSAGKLAKGIDVRGIGGYVVIPPSTLGEGKEYKFANENEIVLLPAFLVEKLTKEEKSGFQYPKFIPSGERHNDLFKIASSLRGKGLSENEVRATLYALRDSRVEEKVGDEISDEELENIIGSVCKYEQGTLEKHNLTDLGNAKRLIDIHGNKILYCRNEREWFIWNGKFWELDTKGKVCILAEDVIKRLHEEAAEAKDSEERKQLAAHAFRSESGYSIREMVKLAENHLPVALDEFDTDKELLNVKNGIVNLRTGEIFPHNPKYKMSKYVDFEYHPEAKCPKWLEFLNFVLKNDSETIHWIQKALGYSVSGRSDAKILPFLYGEKGYNGKSTFVETLMRIFKDYSQKTNIEALADTGKNLRDGERPKAYLARLKGARFVVANETRGGVKLDADFIKDLTGNDSLSARGVHERKVIQFSPTHTIWIYGNNKPKIDDDGDAIWERVCLIPFDVVIPVEMRRPMDEVINDFLEEGEGILAWIIEGFKLFAKEGLKKTNVIDSATKEYRSEEDILKQFLDEEVEFSDNSLVLKDTLISSYKNYCLKNGDGEAILSKAKITRRLKDMGIEDSGSGRKYFKGIKFIFSSDKSIENKADNGIEEGIGSIFSL